MKLPKQAQSVARNSSEPKKTESKADVYPSGGSVKVKCDQKGNCDIIAEYTF